MEKNCRATFRCCQRCGKRPKTDVPKFRQRKDRRDWRVAYDSYASDPGGYWTRVTWCQGCWSDTLKWAPELDTNSPLFAGRQTRRYNGRVGGFDPSEDGRTTTIGSETTMLQEPEGGDYVGASDVLDLIGGKLDKRVKARIDGVPKPGTYGLDIPLRIGKEKVIKSVKPSSQSYRKLFKGFGPDEKKWDGRDVAVTVSEMKTGEFKGKNALYLEPWD